MKLFKKKDKQRPEKTDGGHKMKLFRKKEKQKSDQAKVQERREEVLAVGRKFKYPLQWSKHRVVVNTILITTVVIAVVVTGIWLALYKLNMTDEFLFRVTRILPVPVASVDAEPALFADYLMLYRSSMTSIERQSGSQFDEQSLEELRQQYKRAALVDTEKYALATKLAKELEVSVSQDEIDEEFARHLSVGGVERSEESFVKIIKDNFGLSKNEYERMLELSILKAKVSMAIDEDANKIAAKVETLLAENDNDYEEAAEKLGDQVIYQETGGLVDSKNIDGGRATEAMKLEPGESSGRFVSMNGDGYYFVKLIRKTDTEANFVSIKVPFTEFDKRFDAVQAEDKIREFIELADSQE